MPEPERETPVTLGTEAKRIIEDLADGRVENMSRSRRHGRRLKELLKL